MIERFCDDCDRRIREEETFLIVSRIYKEREMMNEEYKDYINLELCIDCLNKRKEELKRKGKKNE